MKMLLKVKDVPYMGKVTKKTGDKQYEVRDKVVIYSENCDKPINELKALPGTRLLISIDPAYSFTIVSVPDTLEVLWEVSPNELEQYLYDMENVSPEEYSVTEVKLKKAKLVLKVLEK